MRLVASLEHDECENGSESYSASAGGHFGRRMYPSCRPVRLSLGATCAARKRAVTQEPPDRGGVDIVGPRHISLSLRLATGQPLQCFVRPSEPNTPLLCSLPHRAVRPPPTNPDGKRNAPGERAGQSWRRAMRTIARPCGRCSPCPASRSAHWHEPTPRPSAREADSLTARRYGGTGLASPSPASSRA
jgi:hypothetical protein